MLTRLSKHLSFANVVAVMALFIALGSGAYAAKKLSGKSIKNNSIPAKKLKNNSIPAKKLKPAVLTNLDKCPANAPNKVMGICYGSAQAPNNWDAAAQQGCRPQNLRLPTIGEALIVMTAIGGGETNETWTDEVTDLSAPGRAFVKAPGDALGQIFSAPPGSNHSYRCVINATN
jgi:hypothetical protein